MVEALSEDFDFRVLTDAENLDEASSEEQYGTEEWRRIRDAQVRYVSSGEQRLDRLARYIASLEFDLIYLNAFFPTPFTLPVLALNRLGYLEDTPVVIAPRGQLYEGALNKKSYKKAPFLKFAQLTGLYEGLHWHATSQAEAEQIRRAMGAEKPISIAPNLGTMPDPSEVADADWDSNREGPLRVIFLSRISPKKNLLGAIEILNEWGRPAVFDIYGPISDESYWEACRRQIEKAPKHLQITHHGSIPHDEVFEAFASHNLFLFPTHGENYGHVIFESLAAGCPVLVSQTTPWRDLEEVGAGWDVPLEDTEEFCRRLDQAADADPPEWNECRKDAREFALDEDRIERDIDDLRQVFMDALSDHPGEGR